jgi:multicomponent Na+:H+ antiporter subunit C
VILLFSAVVAVLFGAGTFLMLKTDLLRVVVGMVLISHAANLTLMASGLTRGRSPIHPLPDEEISDPLVQAMTLTAIVIGFGVTALLLAIAYRVYTTHFAVDFDRLAAEEARREAELEREEVSV